MTAKKAGTTKRAAATKHAGESATSIHSRAMLVNLSISTWTARKFDKRVTEKVNREHAAGKDAGRYNKNLLGGSADAHAAVVSAAGAARNLHYENTLPWTDEGWRLLPTANYTAYTDALRQARREFESALEQFLDEYPALQTEARQRLNGLYNAADYPSPSEIRRKFGFAVDFTPIPAVGDLRVDLAADQVADIQSSIAGRVERATQEAMEAAWQRLHESVSHLQSRLSDPDLEAPGASGAAKRASIRESLVRNVADVADVLKRLNVLDDPKLEEMRQRVAEIVAGLDAQVLRENKDARTDTAARAQSILDQMQGIFGGAK
jgi:hypothetical protein